MTDDEDFNMGEMFMSIEGFEEPEEVDEPTPQPAPASPLRQLVSQWMGNEPPPDQRSRTDPRARSQALSVDFSRLVYSYMDCDDCEEGECLFIITSAAHCTHWLNSETSHIFDGPMSEEGNLSLYFEQVTEGNYVFAGSRTNGERILREGGAREEPRLVE